MSTNSVCEWSGTIGLTLIIVGFNIRTVGKKAVRPSCTQSFLLKITRVRGPANSVGVYTHGVNISMPNQGQPLAVLEYSSSSSSALHFVTY